MCKASIVAKKTIDAVHGDNLDVGISQHGLGAFHHKGVPVTECVTCVKGGTVLTLKSIPLNLQQNLGIGPMAVATFVDTGHNVQDMVVFENGKQVPLIDFANKGVTAYIGVLETASEADEDIDDANEGNGGIVRETEDHRVAT